MFGLTNLGSVSTLGSRFGGGAPIPELPTDGLLANWLFSEGAGTTVADEIGTYDIDLTTPTTPNASWVSTGIQTSAGLVQTPSITGARTVAILYKVPYGGSAGFLISGGSASGSGPLGPSSAGPVADTYHVGAYNGVHPIFRRSDTGAGAWELQTQGWKVLFRQFSTAYNTILGFGGRHSTTTSRYTTFDIAWAGVYNDVLTDGEREQVYDFCRHLIAQRSQYLDWRDAPAKVDGVVQWGQSNADGRAVISELSAPDQAQTFTKVKLSLQSYTRSNTTFSTLTIGSGHNNHLSTLFGPEIGIAQRREAAGGRDIYINKTALGGTWLAPSSVDGVAVGQTWSTDELPTTAGFWGSGMPALYNALGAALLSGVGVEIKALFWMQGEQDATLTGAADVYEAHLEALWSNFKTYSGWTDAKFVVGRILDTSPSDATAYATVRAAQAAAVSDINTATPGVATLIDTDAFPQGDSVHFDADGQLDLGFAFYDAVF